MTQLLVFKEHIQKFYQKYAFFLDALFRGILGFIVFASINRTIGYNPTLNNLYAELVMAVVSIFMPGGVLLFTAAVFVTVHIFYVSKMLALVVAVIFAIFYFGYAKFLPKHAYIMFAIPIAVPLHLAYGIPVFLGLTMTPVAVIPIVCGVGIYYLLQAVTSVVSTSTDTSINLYHVVLQQFSSDREMYVMIAIFSVVAVLVYIIRNREWDYSFELAIIAGTVSNMILFLIVNYLLDISINTVRFLVGTVVSAVIVWIIQFMRLALNYAGVENLQFEDEEYYYYVRAVPKMNVAAPSKRIKRINARYFSEHMPELDKTEESKETEEQQM